VNDCEKCEELLQPWLDRELNDVERAEAEVHLNGCAYCQRRYKFEVELRRFVRQAADEPMPVQLRERLAALRISL
jgi:anti-sigma factor (TIGR02949 family)